MSIQLTTKEQRDELDALCRPIIKWLNDNYPNHTKVIIDDESVELTTSLCAYRTKEFLHE